MTDYYVCKLSQSDYDYAEKQLGETVEIRNTSLKLIQNWLKENPNIKAKSDALSLLYFLRGCKFDIEKTKWKIEKYYKMRGEIPEWFENRDPTLENLQELLKLGVFLPLKQRDDNNRFIVLIRTAAHDPKKHSQNDVFKIGKMILDLALFLDERISIYGVTAIFDMQNVTLQHALQLPPTLIKKSVDSWRCYPTMVKQLAFVNAPSYINVVLNVFRTFMTNKLRQRVTVHKEGLSHIEGVPGISISGNEVINDLVQHWNIILINHQNWFTQDDKYKTQLK